MASSDFYNDHHSPLSSNEHSTATSPYMIKPPVAASFAHKQRSSSMNSITSNHSVLNHPAHAASSVPTPTNARSMSIVSIESARNSIVSIDDSSRPLRTNSNISLASFGTAVPVAGSPSGGMPSHSGGDVAHHPRDVVHRVASPPSEYANRLKLHNSALFSDDDSELELPTPIRAIAKPMFKLKKHPPSNADTLDHLEQIKSDFRFKYKDHIGAPAVSPPPAPVSGTGHHFKHLQDPTPSPLSLNTQEKELGLDLHAKAGDKIDSAKLTKKVKPSSSMQKMYLKKIYSKELQFELLHNSNVSPPVSPTISYSDSFHPDLHNKFAVPHANPHLPRKTESLTDQNKAITKLNQKWNKSMYSEALGKKKDDVDSDRESKHGSESKKEEQSRKRSRDWADDDDDDTFGDRDDY